MAPSDPWKIISCWVNSIWDVISAYLRDSFGIAEKYLILIHWWLPNVGWVKINSDGAFCSSSGLATCGGLICDHHGGRLGGFAKKVGRCGILKAELQDFCEGLKMAWEKGFRRVVIEFDSLCSINMISRKWKVGRVKVWLRLFGHCLTEIGRFSWSTRLGKVIEVGMAKGRVPSHFVTIRICICLSYLIFIPYMYSII